MKEVRLVAGTLVLDNTWRPVDVVSPERAITLVVTGKAVVQLEYEGWVFRSPSMEIAVPKVISLKVYVPISKRMSRHVTNRLLFMRDNETCQYCGKSRRKDGVRLTKDHVKPVSRHSGKNRKERYAKANVWENVVTACLDCNNKKDMRLPMECGMYPKKTPARPRGVVLHLVSKVDEEQYEYLRPFVE
jgi:5-methylcytosine-specific restriction endonuclease McrA